MWSLFALSWHFFHEKWHVFKDASTAFRFPGMVMGGLALYVTNRLRWLEANCGATRVVELAEVLDAPGALDAPPAVERLPGPLRCLCTTALERARARTAAASALHPPGPGAV